MKYNIILYSILIFISIPHISCGDPDPNDPEYIKAKKEIEDNMSQIKVVKDFTEYKNIVINTFKTAIQDIKYFETTDRLFGQGKTSISSAFSAAQKAKESCRTAHATMALDLRELENIPVELQPILKEISNNFELYYNTSASGYSKAMNYYETGINKKAFKYSEDIQYANFYLATGVKKLKEACEKQGDKLNIKIFTN